jgi:hypothetical protein
MPAPLGSQNALGNKGATLNDRKLAAEVRTLTLKKFRLNLLEFFVLFKRKIMFKHKY